MGSLFERIKGLAPGRRVGRFCTLDFDSRRLRIVQADSTGGQVRILRLVTADLPEGTDVTKAEAVGEFIGRALGRLRLKGAAVLMSVPRGQAVLKPIILPPVSGPGELASMVQFQAAKELTFRPDEAVVDFTIESHYGAEPATDNQPQGEHVLVAAVQKPVLEYYRKIADVAGVRLMRLGLRPYANLRCVHAYGGLQSRGRVAVIHVTTDETEIDVLEEGGLTFSRSAVVPVPAVAADAAAVAAAVETVGQEVARSLQSYMAVERAQRIDTVLLAGGTGIEENVATDLAARLGVRCEMLRPETLLGLDETPADTSAFVSALGLAAGQGDTEAPPFDFLNPKRAPVERDLTRLVAIGAVAAVVLVVVAAFAGAAIHLHKASAHVSALTEQLNTLTKENRKVAALKKRVDGVDGWTKDGRNWLDQWACLSARFPSCREAYVTSFKTNPDGSLTLGLKARTNEVINDVAERLTQAGYDYKPGQVTAGADGLGYLYSTSVKVIVKPDMTVNVASLETAPRPENDVSAEKVGQAPAAAKPAPKAERKGRRAAPAAEAAEAPAAEAPPPVAPAAPAAAGPVTEEQWQATWDALMKERPPADQTEAVGAWRERREALRRNHPRKAHQPDETRYPNGQY